MKIAIMQPYFFPYIGYYQLMNYADIFVVYDDVNFIKQGWINRNRILLNERDFFITIPIEKLSSFRKINELNFIDNSEYMLKTIKSAYYKAENFEAIYAFIQDILKYKTKSLTELLYYSIRKTADYLGIKTELKLSSDIVKNNDLKGAEKVIEICKILSADEYINPIGGTELYKKEAFKENSIELKFIKSREITYRQTGKEFIPNLSILDVMMFNGTDKINLFLNEYDLI